MTVVRGRWLLMITCAVAGCGAPESATSPSTVAPSTPPVSAAPGTVTPAPLAFIMDTALRPLVGAEIQIVDGPQAGTVLTADARGQFQLTGPFRSDNTFRASKDGFVTETRGFSSSSPNGALWLGFYLRPIEAPVDIAGDYRVTLIADSACTDLPGEVRTRTYSAKVVPEARSSMPSSTWFSLAVDAPVLQASYGLLDGFDIGVAGTTLGFWLDGSHDPTLVERLDTSTYLAYSGIGWTTIDPAAASTISASFDGWVDYCVMHSPMGGYYNCGTSNVTGQPIPGASITRVHCESTSHRVILARTSAPK